MSRRRKDVRYHVVGGGRDADGPVWFVMRRDDLHDWNVATARTRAAARQTARELARAATPARSDAGDGLDVGRLARAMEKVERDGLIGGLLGDDWGRDDHGHPVRNDWSTAAIETARAVAAEYDRLSHQGPHR